MRKVTPLAEWAKRCMNDLGVSEDVNQALRSLKELQAETAHAIERIESERSLRYGSGAELLAGIDRIRTLVDSIDAIAQDPPA